MMIVETLLYKLLKVKLNVISTIMNNVHDITLLMGNCNRIVGNCNKTVNLITYNKIIGREHKLKDKNIFINKEI